MSNVCIHDCVESYFCNSMVCEGYKTKLVIKQNFPLEVSIYLKEKNLKNGIIVSEKKIKLFVIIAMSQIAVLVIIFITLKVNYIQPLILLLEIQNGSQLLRKYMKYFF